MKAIFNLPHVMTDNEARYLGLVEAVVNYTAPGSVIRANKHNDEFSVSIDPLPIEERQVLIENLLEMHRAMKLKIVFSKSLAISKLISFTINFAGKK